MKLKSVGMGYFLAISDAISILNIAFGFLAILMVIDNNLTYASVCILLAVVFDSVDGWVSRKLNRVDPLGFGMNIDSLADVVSFGAAPMVILYSIGSAISPWAGYLTAIVCLITLICGLLRLTRYNVIADKINYRGFVGLPIPATAIILATYYLSGLFNIVVAAVLMLLASFLMISTIRYPKVDNYYLIGLGALMILLLILPIKIFVGPVNIPALVLFVLSIVYMFMTFLEFFIDDDVSIDREKAEDRVSNVKEVTGTKISNSVTNIKDVFKNMRDTINQISNEDLDVGIKGEAEEEKELIEEEAELFVEEVDLVEDEAELAVDEAELVVDDTELAEYEAKLAENESELAEAESVEDKAESVEDEAELAENESVEDEAELAVDESVEDEAELAVEDAELAEDEAKEESEEEKEDKEEELVEEVK